MNFPLTVMMVVDDVSEKVCVTQNDPSNREESHPVQVAEGRSRRVLGRLQ